MKRLTNHDLYSLKQRFAQLTTFKCHPTAKSAYQRQAMHSDEDVCGGIIFLPHRFHPSPKKKPSNIPVLSMLLAGKEI
jgi:hypothetical protein